MPFFFHAILAPLIISHSADLTSVPSQEGQSPHDQGSGVETPKLGAYSTLWNQSMFTKHDDLVPAPEPAENSLPPGWASDFELSGWTRLDGKLTVYLTHLSSRQTLTLNEDEVGSPDQPRLICLSGEETILDGRARVSMNGETAWISLNPGAFSSAPFPDPSQGNKPPAANVAETAEQVEAPTTIDSRAARLNGPVILDAAATYQTILTPAKKPVLSDEAQRLRERREKLIRDFPRNANL
jgi:hypothetical protein